MTNSSESINQTIRVLIADDHPIMREGIGSVLADCIIDIDIVGFAQDGKTCLERAQKTQPDVILLDINMPDLNGIEILVRLRACCPDVRAIFFTMHSSRYLVRQALEAGALGYVLKEDGIQAIIDALETVVRLNRHFLSPALNPEILTDYLADVKIGTPNTLLTGREREILTYVAEGLSSKTIASNLDISIRTVENHRRNIMEKLRCHSVAELTHYAIETGLFRL